MPDHHSLVRHDYRGSRKSRSIYGNGASSLYAYDAGGRLVQIRHDARSSSNLLTLQYLYDAAGNLRIKNEMDAVGRSAEKYSYNSLYWLTRIRGVTPTPFDPLTIEPPAVPVSQAQFNTQTGTSV